MASLLPVVLDHLRSLVAINTQNQSGDADASQLFKYVSQHLPGFELHQQGRAEDGDLTLHAVRGRPRILVNVHTDTVPAGHRWSCDPLALQADQDRVIGLGACDIKGALACWLAALQQHPHADAALLLCSDEEAGGSRGVRRFLTDSRAYQLAMIAEPTACQAVTAHRGYASAKAEFSSRSGHSSDPRALEDNAIHQASRFLVQAQQLAAQHAEQAHLVYTGLRGICLNAGRIEGGLKNNIIAEHAWLSFGCRPLPGQSADKLLEQIQQLPAARTSSHWQTMAAEPALPAGPDAPDAAEQLARLGLSVGQPVSFWTEAALFSAAGIPAMVCGPGDIAQAHTADEWIALEQLQSMTAIYQRLLAESP